jgi:hypothetical protein
MSYDDDPRFGDARGRDRGAYTPPTDDDDLPFRRSTYDARRPMGGGGRKAPPVTLMISAAVLLALIVAVVVFYNLGHRSSEDAPAIGTPVGQMKVDAPLEAQPVDPAEGVRVYRDEAESTDNPTFVPPPETAPARDQVAPPQAAPVATAPAVKTEPVVPPAPAKSEPAPTTPATGSSAVQIGAFSSTAIADREYAAVAARFGQYASGAGKRVQEVTASNGSVVYRTTFTGLSRERATAFCNALKSAGRECIVR